MSESKDSAKSQAALQKPTEKAAEEALDVLLKMSQILDTGLDRTQLSILVALSECGVSPHALADIIRELRTESQ